MKAMTCRQLGGACDKTFKANTFQEMAQLSQKHGIEMMKQGDQAHLEAMEKMKKLMTTPDQMNQWMQDRANEFEVLPDID